jgi:hypothetical protein
MTNNQSQKRRTMLQDIWPEVTAHVNKEYQLSLTVGAARKRYYRGDVRVARAYKDAVIARKKNADEYQKIQSEIKAIVNSKTVES